MKNLSQHLLLNTMIAITFFLTSCLNDKFNEVSNVILNYEGFKFNTTEEINVTVKALANNSPLNGIQVSLYSQNPLDEAGQLISEHEQALLFKGITNKEGKMSALISPKTSTDSIYALVSTAGIPTLQAQKINSLSILNFDFGDNISTPATVKANRIKSAFTDGPVIIDNFWKVNDLYTFTTWTTKGVPNNLIPTNDVVSAGLLADINESLPEMIPLPTSHPEYLESQEDGSIILIENAEVWVTFVHEGAGYTNTLSYYSYPTNTPPASKSDIKNNTIVFPNVSFLGSGGGLVSGNKVQLMYFDQASNTYTSIFPAGTSISWMIRANGWSNNTIGNGYNNFFSTSSFNPETNSALRKHNVILKDDARQLLLIGFEDLKRDAGSDNDFNDAVFYATVSPYTAIKNSAYKPIDTPVDTDGDGVTDTRDEYPTDPERAFNNFYPSKSQKGTLVFEDLWPTKGDYDFNDMVIYYQINQITNANNQVVDIEADYTLKAIGAHFHNGFAFALNTPANNVKYVTGQHLSANLFMLNSNQTEADVENAVIAVFDNAHHEFYSSGNGAFVNVNNSAEYKEPKTTHIKLSFVNPVSTATLGSAPFNPFMIVDQMRSKEIHLPGHGPTSKVDTSLFGKGQDNSDLSVGKFYMSNQYLPWALNLPIQFEYPTEKSDITTTYLKFNAWAQSRGLSYTDWYANKSGYRESSKIYNK